MVSPSSPNVSTVADETRFGSNDTYEATNLNTPKSDADVNSNELSTTSSHDRSSDEHSSDCLDNSSEGSRRGKDDLDGQVQSWVLCAIDKNGVAKEKIFYPRSVSNDGLFLRYFRATYANGAEKSVRLDQESARYRLTQMTAADRAFIDGSGDKFDHTMERWAIDAIYPNARRKRLYPDSSYDDRVPITKWQICAYLANGDLDESQLYPEMGLLENTLAKERPPSHDVSNETNGGVPESSGDGTAQCAVAGGNEQPISSIPSFLAEPEQEMTQSSRESSEITRGDSPSVVGYYAQSDDEVSWEDEITDKCSKECELRTSPEGQEYVYHGDECPCAIPMMSSGNRWFLVLSNGKEVDIPMGEDTCPSTPENTEESNCGGARMNEKLEQNPYSLAMNTNVCAAKNTSQTAHKGAGEAFDEDTMHLTGGGVARELRQREQQLSQDYTSGSVVDRSEIFKRPNSSQDGCLPPSQQDQAQVAPKSKKSHSESSDHALGDSPVAETDSSLGPSNALSNCSRSKEEHESHSSDVPHGGTAKRGRAEDSTQVSGESSVTVRGYSPSAGEQIVTEQNCSENDCEDTPPTKKRRLVKTFHLELDEVQTMDDTCQRQIRSKGWEKYSSLETREKFLGEIFDDRCGRSDVIRWCEINIPHSRPALKPKDWEAPHLSYEKSVTLSEQLRKQFGEPSPHLSWLEACVTWKYMLKENTLNGFLSIGYKIGEGLELSFVGTERASSSALALLDPLDLFGDKEPYDKDNLGCTKPYTQGDAIQHWEFNDSPDDTLGSDEAKHTLDDWTCWDNSQLYSLKGKRGFGVAPARCHLPSDVEELLPPSAQDSRRIYDRLQAAFRGASSQLDVSYDKNWEFSISRRQHAHGEKSVPSRLSFEGHEEAGGTCGFVFEGKAHDVIVALRLIWSLLRDDWDCASMPEIRGARL